MPCRHQAYTNSQQMKFGKGPSRYEQAASKDVARKEMESTVSLTLKRGTTAFRTHGSLGRRQSAFLVSLHRLSALKPFLSTTHGLAWKCIPRSRLSFVEATDDIDVRSARRQNGPDHRGGTSLSHRTQKQRQPSSGMCHGYCSCRCWKGTRLSSVLAAHCAIDHRMVERVKLVTEVVKTCLF